MNSLSDSRDETVRDWRRQGVYIVRCNFSMATMFTNESPNLSSGDQAMIGGKQW